jgi:Cupin-like domain
MKIEPVPIIQNMNTRDFSQWISKSETPLVITDAMQTWPAMQGWSFNYFSDEFNDFPVIAHAPQFPSLAKWCIKTTLGRYVEYLHDPVSIKGEWMRGDIESLITSGLTLYSGNFNPAHPLRGNPNRIFADVPEMPEFIESWLDMLNPQFVSLCQQVQSHHFVYLSISGGVTPLHHDFWDTHAFLAQIRGTKRAFLFHPKYMRELYSDHSGDVLKMFSDPCYDHITCWSAELSPGKLLIIPSRWLHWVETLSPSITYSADWIDGTNWKQYVEEGRRFLEERQLWP